jgi:hypothetical protein
MAAYSHALDDGRVHDLVATFCPDGVFESRATGTHVEGRDALQRFFAGAPHPQRLCHVLCNTLVTDWNDREATVSSDLVVMTKGPSGWTIGGVRRYRDRLHNHDGAWTFHQRILDFVD